MTLNMPALSGSPSLECKIGQFEISLFSVIGGFKAVAWSPCWRVFVGTKIQHEGDAAIIFISQ